MQKLKSKPKGVQGRDGRLAHQIPHQLQVEEAQRTAITSDAILNKPAENENKKKKHY